MSLLRIWARSWTLLDAEVLDVAKDDPAGQARWEAFALLVSFIAWGHIIATVRGNIAVVGDAQGVLHAYVKFKANDAKINEIMMELAVRIAPLGRDLGTFHLYSEMNAEADQLSRLSEGAQLPPRLTKVRRSQVSLGQWLFLGR